MYICINIALATKAEFDSALADFNARLTTFEAGINSKIDSQVTSYLDRNGIWSGKEIDYSSATNRTLGSDGKYYYWCNTWADIFNRAGITGYTNDVDITFPAGAASTNGQMQLGFFCFGKCEKAGLLILQVQWVGAGNQQDRFGIIAPNGGTTNGIMYAKVGIGKKSENYYKNWGSDSSRFGNYAVEVIDKPQGVSVLSSMGTQNTTTFMLYGEPVQVYNFMVSKGDVIYFEFLFNIYFGSITGTATLQARNSWGGYNSSNLHVDAWRPHLNIMKAEVY